MNEKAVNVADNGYRLLHYCVTCSNLRAYSLKVVNGGRWYDCCATAVDIHERFIAGTWQLTISINKCCVLNVGEINEESKFYIDGCLLRVVTVSWFRCRSDFRPVHV